MDWGDFSRPDAGFRYQIGTKANQAIKASFSDIHAEALGLISAEGKTDEQIAAEGLAALENWMKKLGVALSISELGATEEMIDGIADGTIILDGGYKTLTKDEVKQVLRESM